jgi:hypothetical protein
MLDGRQTLKWVIGVSDQKVSVVQVLGGAESQRRLGLRTGLQDFRTLQPVYPRALNHPSEKNRRLLVGAAGLEPATLSLEG